MTKLDKNRFTGMHELANNLSKGRSNYSDNIVEAMHLAQTYRYDGRVIGDVIINTRDIEASPFVNQSYKSKNKSSKRKADEDICCESEKNYSRIKC